MVLVAAAMAAVQANWGVGAWVTEAVARASVGEVMVQEAVVMAPEGAEKAEVAAVKGVGTREVAPPVGAAMVLGHSGEVAVQAAVQAAAQAAVQAAVAAVAACQAIL